MATWLLEVYFCPLPVTYRTSDTLKVIEVFPDVRWPTDRCPTCCDERLLRVTRSTVDEIEFRVGQRDTHFRWHPREVETLFDNADGSIQLFLTAPPTLVCFSLTLAEKPQGRNSHDRYVRQTGLPRHVTNHPDLPVLSCFAGMRLLYVGSGT